VSNINDFVIARAALSRALGAAQEAVEQIDRFSRSALAKAEVHGELACLADDLRDKLFATIRAPLDYD